jgi:hypothetical protein
MPSLNEKREENVSAGDRAFFRTVESKNIKNMKIKSDTELLEFKTALLALLKWMGAADEPVEKITGRIGECEAKEEALTRRADEGDCDAISELAAVRAERLAFERQLERLNEKGASTTAYFKLKDHLRNYQDLRGRAAKPYYEAYFEKALQFVLPYCSNRPEAESLLRQTRGMRAATLLIFGVNLGSSDNVHQEAALAIRQIDALLSGQDPLATNLSELEKVARQLAETAVQAAS